MSYVSSNQLLKPFKSNFNLSNTYFSQYPENYRVRPGYQKSRQCLAPVTNILIKMRLEMNELTLSHYHLPNDGNNCRIPVHFSNNGESHNKYPLLH